MTDKDSLVLLSDLIGKAYQPGGYGPEVFDCWGLVSYCYKKLFNTKLNSFCHIDARSLKSSSEQFELASQSSEWINIVKPEHGCIVAMSRSKVIHHVGIWLNIDSGVCLHALDGQCVIAETIGRLKQQHFSKILFFKYGKSIYNN